MKVLFDTNVLLDAMLAREPFVAASKGLNKLRDRCFIATLKAPK